MNQAKRVNEMIEAAGGWRVHHLHLDQQSVWQIARMCAVRRGLGIFDDHEKKCEINK